MRRWFLLVPLCLSTHVWADWSVRQASPKIAQQPACVLETEWRTVFDGYQDTQVQVIVSTGKVEARSKAPLDNGSLDISIKVDDKDQIKPDGIKGEKIAGFDTASALLVEQFIKGKSLRLQMRFWPTWPQTGVHVAEFTLIGFTKAHNEFLKCE